MFNEPRVNVIACDEGFSVEVLGRIGLTYTEGPRRMFIDSELLAGPRGIAVCANRRSRWEPPHDDEPLSMARWLLILENVRRAFRWSGYDISIHWPNFAEQVITYDLQHGYPTGDNLFYECLACHTIVPSLPPDSTSCRCHNIKIDGDNGRLSIRNQVRTRLIAVD